MYYENYLRENGIEEMQQTDAQRSVFCLCEEYEGDDGIREFQILGVSADKDALQKLMQAKIKEDEYGLIKENGVSEQGDYSFCSNFDEGFVEYYILEQPVLARDEVEKMVAAVEANKLSFEKVQQPALDQQIQSAAVNRVSEPASVVSNIIEAER